jgi:hypothetical protein
MEQPAPQNAWNAKILRIAHPSTSQVADNHPFVPAFKLDHMRTYHFALEQYALYDALHLDLDICRNNAGQNQWLVVTVGFRKVTRSDGYQCVHV